MSPVILIVDLGIFYFKKTNFWTEKYMKKHWKKNREIMSETKGEKFIEIYVIQYVSKC